MTKLQQWLEEQKQICEKATEGPWKLIGNDDDGKGQWVSASAATGTDEDDQEHCSVCTITDASYSYACNYHKNGSFISNSRTALPIALKVIERLVRALEHIESGPFYDIKGYKEDPKVVCYETLDIDPKELK